ncbi:hypothetical protein ACJJTC_010257 [Scirpophaga incertulas]
MRPGYALSGKLLKLRSSLKVKRPHRSDRGDKTSPECSKFQNKARRKVGSQMAQVSRQLARSLIKRKCALGRPDRTGDPLASPERCPAKFEPTAYLINAVGNLDFVEAIFLLIHYVDVLPLIVYKKQ